MLSHLFSPFHLGDLELPNRVVMAPMTRSRALGNVPNALMAEYYAQRASAGLLITEGTSPSPNGLGYARIPGIFSAEQVAGWRTVTDRVHEAGGRIFVQLMHVGRIGHPLNLPAGAELVAPSAVAAAGEMYTDQEGPKAHPAPRAMSEADVRGAVAEFTQAARNAMEAGFDGVELHGANGYLIDQFLNPITNQRTDDYGGSDERRMRFGIEVATSVVDALGPGRVGIRVSPNNPFNGLGTWETADTAYVRYAERLGEVGLAYLHLIDMSAMMGYPFPERVKTQMREAFGGPVILNGGYDAAAADREVAEGRANLVAFGRPFLGNPDLVARLRGGAALVDARQELLYTPGPEGYTDYPALS